MIGMWKNSEKKWVKVKEKCENEYKVRNYFK